VHALDERLDAIGRHHFSREVSSSPRRSRSFDRTRARSHGVARARGRHIVDVICRWIERELA
jgi:hypothetical protein